MRSTMRVVLFLSLSLLLIDTKAVTQQQDLKVIREVISARFQRLQNLIVDYEITTNFSPVYSHSPVIKRNGTMLIMDTGTRVSKKVVSFLDGMARYDLHANKWDRQIEHPDLDKIPFIEKRIDVFRPDKTERLLVQKDKKNPRGEIVNHGRLPDGDIEIALGLRKRLASDLLTDRVIDKLDLELSNNNEAIMREIDAKGVTHEWIFDRRLGYALTTYRKLIPPKNYVNVEFVMKDFKNIDGIMLPFSIHSNIYTSRREKVRTDSIKVNRYSLNDPENTPERYHIKWPEGSKIVDTRSGIQFSVKDGNLSYIHEERILDEALDEIQKIPLKNSVKIKAVSHKNESDSQQSDANNRYSSKPEIVAIQPKQADIKALNKWCAFLVVLALVILVVGILYIKKRKQI